MRKFGITVFLGMLLIGIACACGAGEGASDSVVAAAPAAEEEASVESTAPVGQEPSVAESEITEEGSVPEKAEGVEDSTTAEEASSADDAMQEEPGMDEEALFADYLDEPAVQEMYAEVADQFQQMEYTDEETGLTIPYNLFVPDQAASGACPMVVFISDSSTVGRDVTAPLQQGYGGIIWATETEQQKHPSYVLVPQYSEIVIDDNQGETVSAYVEATARLIQTVAGENNVDQDRIYATGQSMGCMTFLYLASSHPDLFAAELFVSGQWRVDELQNLGTQTFFYVAAGGDAKASAGQAEVLADLESKGIAVTTAYDWDATWTDAEFEPSLRQMLAGGTEINIGQFVTGTVMEANPGRGEHMSSFDCVYKIDAIRNWLFMQSK